MKIAEYVLNVIDVTRGEPLKFIAHPGFDVDALRLEVREERFRRAIARATSDDKPLAKRAPEAA